MTGALEDKLPRGIQTSVGDKDIPVFPEHLDEVEKFDPKVADNGVPFVGHRERFKEFVRLLRTQYPYVNLEGDFGIGKTLMINFALGVIKGEISIEELEKEFPDLVEDFEAIKKRVKRFQHRDYLILPNLHAPTEYTALDYTDPKKSEVDSRTARQFCDDISTVLSNYAMDNRHNIRLLFSEDEFKEYIRFRINELYVELYKQVADVTCPTKKGTKRSKEERT